MHSAASDKSLKDDCGINKFRVSFSTPKRGPEVHRPRLEVDGHHEIRLLLSFYSVEIYTIILSIWLSSSMSPHGQKMTARAPDITSMHQAERRRKGGRAKGVHFS